MSGTPTAPQAGTLIAGLDPGRSKCGLVLADAERKQVLEAAILPPQDCVSLLQDWHHKGLGAVLVGNGTGSSSWRHSGRGGCLATTSCGLGHFVGQRA